MNPIDKELYKLRVGVAAKQMRPKERYMFHEDGTEYSKVLTDQRTGFWSCEEEDEWVHEFIYFDDISDILWYMGWCEGNTPLT